MEYRVEDKYDCDEMEMKILQARVGAVLRADDNQKDTLGYRITSLYFDDLYDTCLHDTVSGVAMRRKYRIRIYNNSLDTIKLEVKYKRYNKVHKQSVRISREQMEAFLHGRCVEDAGVSEDNPITIFNTAISQRGLRPRVIVEYDRKAYVFRSGNVRITFDRNIKSSREVFGFGTKNLTFTPLRETDGILEVKFDEFLPGFIAQLLELGDMNQTSYSKYRLCRENEQ